MNCVQSALVCLLFPLVSLSMLSLRDFSCSVSFIVLLLYLVGPIKYYDRLNGEGTGCFAFRYFVNCVQSALVCLLFPLVSLSMLCATGSSWTWSLT